MPMAFGLCMSMSAAAPGTQTACSKQCVTFHGNTVVHSFSPFFTHDSRWLDRLEIFREPPAVSTNSRHSCPDNRAQLPLHPGEFPRINAENQACLNVTLGSDSVDLRRDNSRHMLSGLSRFRLGSPGIDTSSANRAYRVSLLNLLVQAGLNSSQYLGVTRPFTPGPRATGQLLTDHMRPADLVMFGFDLCSRNR
ncbi:hypothetical protein VTI74DRAFT_140 [Chaetomium olivicolor]